MEDGEPILVFIKTINPLLVIKVIYTHNLQFLTSICDWYFFKKKLEPTKWELIALGLSS
jgi:hypothetical protein